MREYHPNTNPGEKRIKKKKKKKKNKKKKLFCNTPHTGRYQSFYR